MSVIHERLPTFPTFLAGLGWKFSSNPTLVTVQQNVKNINYQQEQGNKDTTKLEPKRQNRADFMQSEELFSLCMIGNL